jgi:hypothetical protein
MGRGQGRRAGRGTAQPRDGVTAGRRRRGGRGGARRAGEKKGRGRREREGKGRGKTHLRGSKFRRSRFQTLGHHGEREREVEDREGGYCAGEIK